MVTERVDDMAASRNIDPYLIATHTTVAPSAVAHWMLEHYGIATRQCFLIRRGLNDNYQLEAADGTRYVARLYSIRPRGAFNVDFETALLMHLAAKGVGVAASIPAKDGQQYIPLQFPEGPRVMTVFHYLEGAVPETLEDFEVTGRELARIHKAASDYTGPSSVYKLDGPFLASRTLDYMRAHPLMENELLNAYCSHANHLLNELEKIEHGLNRVLCHGDMHGFNNHVYQGPSGVRKTGVFDFDDAGPGFLAYDLAVMPWSYLFRKGLTTRDDVLCERWAKYIGAYREAGGEILECDLKAVPLFLQLRHFWNIGEAIGRIHHWGTSVFSLDWLRKQLDIMVAWDKIDLNV